MKITRILLAFLLVLPFLQSCQNDITELTDPRDAIAKAWDVVDNTVTGANGYRVVISKSTTDKTKIIMNNFHNLGEDVTATMAGYNITVPSQTIPGGYTIAGDGVIASDQKTIKFECDETTADGTVTVVSDFGQVVTAKKTGVLITRP